jgi:hypothetical protein
MAQVVCFGILTPAVLLTVDQFPRHNTGALINEVSELVCDDGALVASLLSQWGISSGVIGNSLGDDERGCRLIQQLESENIEHQIALDPKISTPLELRPKSTLT